MHDTVYNPVNYTLDIADLRRHGILVDTTPIPRDPNAPNHYYQDY